MTDKLDVAEFITGFLAEAEELISTANANLVLLDQSLRKREHNPRAVRELFRALHTLKGLSAMVGAEPIVDVSHEMETLLRAADRAGGKVPLAAVDLLIRGVKAIDERVKSLAKGEPLAKAPQSLVEALAALQVDGSEGTEGELDLEPEVLAKVAIAERQQLLQGLAKGRRARRVEFVPSSDKASKGLDITSVRARVSKVAELVKVLPRAKVGGGVSFELLVLTDADDEALTLAAASDGVRPIGLKAQLPSAPLPDDEAPAEEEVGRRNYVRVEVSRLDDALERLAALVVSGAKMQRALADVARGAADFRALAAVVAENGRQLRDLRGAIMRARMVKVSELLERAPLIVRGLARASNKPVQLHLETGDAELDKTVADRLFPAVVHLLRNAVDHAIESGPERKAAGKTEEGHIRISCVERAGNMLELSITDDGSGIDAAKVAKRARAPVPATESELLDLICRPGLSTLDAATHTSGRGYGMDIVKRVTVDELGGALSLVTKPGTGTTFRLEVPLSITIVEAFSFVSGTQTFVVPVSVVEELTELDPKNVITGPERKHGTQTVRLMRHREANIPLVTLDALFGAPARDIERPKVIVVRNKTELIGIQVDRMLGQQEIVLRPITDPLVTVKGISGSTDLGDGRPTLVLDLPGLVQHSKRRSVS